MATWNAWAQEEQYCWVVICKNRKFHKQQNLFAGHKIPLGETDAFSPPPALNGQLTVRCDECGQETTYESSEVVRFQMGLAPNFRPHPLFVNS